MCCDEGQPTREGEALEKAICGECEGHINGKIKILWICSHMSLSSNEAAG